MKLRISQTGKQQNMKFPQGTFLDPYCSSYETMAHKSHIQKKKFKMSNTTQYSASTGYNETQTEESVNTKFLTLKH